MNRFTKNKVFYWIRYVLSIIILSIGVMLLFSAVILHSTGSNKTEDIISCGVLGGICTIIPILLIKKNRESHLETLNKKEVPSEQESSKDIFFHWLDYAWRTAFLIIAIFLFVLTIDYFLTEEQAKGLGCLVIGIILLIPYIKKKSNGNLLSIIHSKRLTWRARLRMFDEEMLSDKEIAIEERKHTCLNCGYDYIGWYCPNCGQDRRKDKIDWRQLILGMVGEAINFDGSTVRTLYELIRQPGIALHNYLSGRHERYSNPMKFVLFSGALFTILSIVLVNDSTSSISYETSMTVFEKLADNIMIYQCIMAFVVDFFPLYWTFKWTKKGRQLRQVDFYIIMLYLIGMDFWARALFCIPMHWLDNDLCNTIRWILVFCYQFYVLKDYFCLRFWQLVGLYIPRYILYLVFVLITLIPFLVCDVVGGTHITEGVANTITGNFMNDFWGEVFAQQ